MEFDKSILSFLQPDLLDEILSESSIQAFPKGTEILKEEQYVKVLPIVVDGLVKVYSRFDEKELLLYYIEPAQSCVMSFYAALKNTPSRVFAETEEDSKIILIPVQYLPNWLKEYPKLDKRLYDHLRRKTELTDKKSIKISHSQLANELGTAREVISRVMKKLETEGKVTQNSGEITIIGK
jgi:CRP/FNR family transcriptional regulator, anaerobic regulatory protein